MAAAVMTMIPAAMALMILLLIPTGCDADTPFKPSLDNYTSNVEKYLVGDQDFESEFLMESHIGRILATSQDFQTGSTNNANEASGGGCNRPPRYDSCLGEKTNIPPSNCGTYNRENPC